MPSKDDSCQSNATMCICDGKTFLYHMALLKSQVENQIFSLYALCLILTERGIQRQRTTIFLGFWGAAHSFSKYFVDIKRLHFNPEKCKTYVRFYDFTNEVVIYCLCFIQIIITKILLIAEV